MLKKPSSCSNCALENIGKGFSIPEGSGRNGVLVLGESLGDREKFDGLPLRPYAEAGSTFQTAIRLLGIERENFIIYNVVNCQPPYNALENTPYEYEAVEHCKVHVRQVIAKHKPKVILALGNVPLKHLNVLTPEVKSYIEELQSTDSKKAKAYLKKFKISSLRGYILPTIYNIPMVASLHPSFITREGRIYIGVLMRDIKTAVQLAQGLIPKFKSNYKEKPSVVEVEAFYRKCKANPNLVISHDIETPESTIQTDESEMEYENVEVRNIDSIQFSVEEGTGIFVPWYGDYLEIIKKILATLNPKIGWNNYAFDKVNIEYHLGKGAIGGQIIDVMWLWKWLNQDFVSMGRSLQFATNFYAPEFPAWKHQAQLEPEKYGVMDVDATLRIYNGLKRDLASKKLFPETKTLYEGFEDDLVKLKPILDWTSENGFPIDPIERERFKKQIVEERNKTLNDLQDLYPTELRKVTPTEGYKFVPKEVIEVEELFKKASSVKNDGLFYIVESDELYNKRLAQYLEEHTRHEETTGLVLKEFQIDGIAERRWCRMEEFKPGSAKQVLDYIKLRKYKVPKKKERGIEDKETTGKDEIYHLWEETSDALFGKVIYYRELDKMLKTYIGTGKTGWKTGSDGRIHTTFTFLPATGQLSSRNPNIQNCVSGDTEILTLRGWIRFDKLLNEDICAQFDLKTSKIDFAAPLDFIVGHSEYINHIKTTDQIDMLLTDDHDCVVQKRRSNKFIKIKAQDFKDDHLHFGAGFYVGGEKSICDSALILIAALQADGHMPNKDKIDWKIKKKRKITRLLEALNDCGIAYKVSTQGEYNRIYVYNSKNEYKLDWLLNKKFFGKWILDLDKRSFKFLANEIWFWDGCYKRKSMYSSSVKLNADWGQILTVLSGRRAKIRKYHNDNPNSINNWQVDASNRMHSMTTNFKKARKLWNDKVYCVTMPKGTMIIRRNGLVSITGNSPARGTKFSSSGYRELATQFRKTIAASSGKMLLAADWSAFHALTLAFEAEDEEYMRVVKLDPHSFVAAHILSGDIPLRLVKLKKTKPDNLSIEGWKKQIANDEEALERFKTLHNWLSLSDDKLKEHLEFIKTNYDFVRNSQAKPAILGMGFGMGVKKFYKLNRHTFRNESEPKRILELIRKLFPKTFVDYHEKIKALADRQTYLISRYGYIRRFYDVYDWRMLPSYRQPTPKMGEKLIRNNKGQWWLRKDGQDANNAIAYLPSNDAFGKKKEAMRDLWEHVKGNMIKRFGLINEIHDELFFEIDKELINEAILMLQSVMESPARYLKNSTAPNGLITKISMKLGPNWAEMEKIKI